MFGPQIDLNDFGIGGIELPIGKIASEHQQRVTVEHRMIARTETDQAGHADVEGVVVFEMFFAAEGMHDRRFQRVGKLHQRLMRAGTTSAAEQSDAPARIEELGQFSQIALVGRYPGCVDRNCLARRGRCRYLLQCDVAGNHNDRNASATNGCAYRGFEYSG